MEWVIIEGGLVSDFSKGVKVFNLDFMDMDVDPDEFDIETAEWTLAEMETYCPELDDDIRGVQEWVDKHKPTDEES